MLLQRSLSGRSPVRAKNASPDPWRVLRQTRVDASMSLPPQSIRVRDSGPLALDAQTESIFETVSRRAQTAFEVLTIRKGEWRVKC